MPNVNNETQQTLIAEALKPLEGETVAAESFENSYINKETIFLKGWVDNHVRPLLNDYSSENSIYSGLGENAFNPKLIGLLYEILPPAISFPKNFTYSYTRDTEVITEEFEIVQYYGTLQALRGALLDVVMDIFAPSNKNDINERFGLALKLFIKQWRLDHERYNTFVFKTSYSGHLKREVDIAVSKGCMNEPTAIMWLVALTAVLAFDMEGHSGSTANMGVSYIRKILEQARHIINNSRDDWFGSLLYRSEQALRSPDSAFNPVFTDLKSNMDELRLSDLQVIEKLIVCATTFGLLSPISLDLETEFYNVGSRSSDAGTRIECYQNNRKSDVFMDVINGVPQTPHFTNGIAFSYNGGLTWFSNYYSRVPLTGDLLEDDEYMTNLPTLRVLIDPIAYEVNKLNHPHSCKDSENFSACSSPTSPFKSNEERKNKYLKQGAKIYDKYGDVLTVTNVVSDRGAIVGYDVTNRKGEKMCVLKTNWENGVGEFNGFKYPMFRPCVPYYADGMDEKRDALFQWTDELEKPTSHTIDIRGYEIPSGITRLFIDNVLYIVADNNKPIHGGASVIQGLKIDFDAIPELLHDWQTIENWKSLSGENVLRLSTKGKGNALGNGGW